jgi:rhodanese-related sulfurtransferase
VATITPQALAMQIEGGHAPLVLDVRSQAEFNQGHVPGAIHIPFWKVGIEGEHPSCRRRTLVQLVVLPLRARASGEGTDCTVGPGTVDT